MIDYEKMYFILFNAITDALNEMDNLNFGSASNVLKQAQRVSEEMYIEGK